MNDKDIARRGRNLVVTGSLFAVAETVYFGSNWGPESLAEWVCDAISLVLVGAGWSMMLGAFTKAIKEKLKNRGPGTT